MKKHLPLAVALALEAISISPLAWFIPRMRLIMALQANTHVTLPPRGAPHVESDSSLKITFTVSGAAFEDGSPYSQEKMARYLAANPEQRVTVVAAPDVKYPHLKAFFLVLGRDGVKSATFQVRNPCCPHSVAAQRLRSMTGVWPLSHSRGASDAIMKLFPHAHNFLANE